CSPVRLRDSHATGRACHPPDAVSLVFDDVGQVRGAEAGHETIYCDLGSLPLAVRRAQSDQDSAILDLRTPMPLGDHRLSVANEGNVNCPLQSGNDLALGAARYGRSSLAADRNRRVRI